MTTVDQNANGREPEIILENVSKHFGAVVAVADLSFTVYKGEIVALVGKTGAGKSTALHAMLGAIPVDRGRVVVAGLDPYRQFKELQGKIAVAFQQDRLLPWRRAWENVALGLEILGVPPRERKDRSYEWLARVDLAGAELKYPHELSGGMRQRVSFARGMVMNPEIILLDESFSALDEVTAAVLRRDFTQLVRSFQRTSVLITHQIEEALEVADRVIVLARPARIVYEVKTTSEERADKAKMTEHRRQIANAMAEEQGEPIAV